MSRRRSESVEVTQGYHIWQERYSSYVTFLPYTMILLLNPRWSHPYERFLLQVQGICATAVRSGQRYSKERGPRVASNSIRRLCVR